MKPSQRVGTIHNCPITFAMAKALLDHVEEPQHIPEKRTQLRTVETMMRRGWLRYVENSSNRITIITSNGREAATKATPGYAETLAAMELA